MELKDFVVIKDDDGVHIWSKWQYETYIRSCLQVGSCPAVTLITHFNEEDRLLQEVVR